MATPSKADMPATYDDANLLLRLYELRREEKLRQARDWFNKNFHANTVDEFLRFCPVGSQENAYYRMVTSYWDMAASFVTNGVLHRDLFVQNSANCCSYGSESPTSYPRGANEWAIRTSCGTWRP